MSQPLKVGIALKVSKSNLQKNIIKKSLLALGKYLMQQLCWLPLYQGFT